MKHIMQSLCRDFYRYTHRHKSSRTSNDTTEKVQGETSIVTKCKNERERERGWWSRFACSIFFPSSQIIDDRRRKGVNQTATYVGSNDQNRWPLNAIWGKPIGGAMNCGRPGIGARCRSCVDEYQWQRNETYVVQSWPSKGPQASVASASVVASSSVYIWAAKHEILPKRETSECF